MIVNFNLLKELQTIQEVYVYFVFRRSEYVRGIKANFGYFIDKGYFSDSALTYGVPYSESLGTQLVGISMTDDSNKIRSHLHFYNTHGPDIRPRYEVQRQALEDTEASSCTHSKA